MPEEGAVRKLKGWSCVQMLTLVLRTQTGEFEVQELMPVRYVPLTRPGE